MGGRGELRWESNRERWSQSVGVSDDVILTTHRLGKVCAQGWCQRMGAGPERAGVGPEEEVGPMFHIQ